MGAFTHWEEWTRWWAGGGGVEKRVGGGMRGRIMVEMKNEIFKKVKKKVCFLLPFHKTTYYLTLLVKPSHRLFGKKTFLPAC